MAPCGGNGAPRLRGRHAACVRRPKQKTDKHHLVQSAINVFEIFDLQQPNRSAGLCRTELSGLSEHRASMGLLKRSNRGTGSGFELIEADVRSPSNARNGRSRHKRAALARVGRTPCGASPLPRPLHPAAPRAQWPTYGSAQPSQAQAQAASIEHGAGCVRWCIVRVLLFFLFVCMRASVFRRCCTARVVARRPQEFQVALPGPNCNGQWDEYRPCCREWYQEQSYLCPRVARRLGKVMGKI